MHGPSKANTLVKMSSYKPPKRNLYIVHHIVEEPKPWGPWRPLHIHEHYWHDGVWVEQWVTLLAITITIEKSVFNGSQWIWGSTLQSTLNQCQVIPSIWAREMHSFGGWVFWTKRQISALANCRTRSLLMKEGSSMLLECSEMSSDEKLLSAAEWRCDLIEPKKVYGSHVAHHT